jgi:hypothetical protein
VTTAGRDLDRIGWSACRLHQPLQKEWKFRFAGADGKRVTCDFACSSGKDKNQLYYETFFSRNLTSPVFSWLVGGSPHSLLNPARTSMFISFIDNLNQ